MQIRKQHTLFGFGSLLLVALLGTAGARHPNACTDPTLDALQGALDAYSRGDFVGARASMRLAIELLDAGESGARLPSRWPGGNAGQLLETLQLYALYVHGSRPELDAEYESLVSDLQRIECLNRGQPLSPFDSEPVEYDLIDKLVTRIGAVRIDYDLITLQLDRIGERGIEYDLLSHQPTRIGDIEFEYDLIDRRAVSVAGVRIP